MARDRDVRNSRSALQLRASPVVSRIRDLVREGFHRRSSVDDRGGLGLFWGRRDRSRTRIHLRPAERCYAPDDPRSPIASTPCAIAWESSPNCLRSSRIGVRSRRSSRRASRSPRPPRISSWSRHARSGAVASIHHRGGTSRGVNLLWRSSGTEGDLQIVDRAGHGTTQNLQLWGARRDDNALQALKMLSARYSRRPRRPLPASRTTSRSST